MGRELAEGKVATLERGAALAKTFGDDLRRAYAELEGHASALDRENEDLQVAVVFMLMNFYSNKIARRIHPGVTLPSALDCERKDPPDGPLAAVLSGLASLRSLLN